MPALTNAELPIGFQTLDQLIVYVGVVYSIVHPKLTYVLNNTTTEKVADKAIIRTSSGQDYCVVRAAVPLNSDYLLGGGPIWTYAEENESVTIPAIYKA